MRLAITMRNALNGDANAKMTIEADNSIALEKNFINFNFIIKSEVILVNTKNITIPPKSEGLAEFIGILLGDGNIWIQKNGTNTNYQLKIAGDLTEDNDYLSNYVKPLCYHR